MAIIEIHPHQLLSGQIPRSLELTSVSASEVARAYGLKLEGEDREIRTNQTLSRLNPNAQQNALSYFGDARAASALAGISGATIITLSQLRAFVPPGNSVLITEEDPRDVFFTVIADSFESGKYERLTSFVSPSARIAPSAVIKDHVFIDEDATICDGAVILSNSYIGPGAVVKPNATIGGNGFEAARIRGRRKIVAHAGGAWLSQDVEIGSSTCVDRGLFGDFTFIGKETKIDNLVQIAHSACIGNGCSIIACCIVSGSTTIDDGAWLGPNVSVNQLLHLGASCYIGTGSVVSSGVAAFGYVLAGRTVGFVCRCRKKMVFAADTNTAYCQGCRTTLVLAGDGTVTEKS